MTECVKDKQVQRGAANKWKRQKQPIRYQENLLENIWKLDAANKKITSGGGKVSEIKKMQR